MSNQLVWLKRDLRIGDHRPLAEAAVRGPCIVLYVYEPELLGSPEFSDAHLRFVNQCLQELDQRLARIGGGITFRTGRIPDVFEPLHRKFRFQTLWSHQETGNRITYDRDLRVARWARQREIEWREIPQNGVVRPLRNRDGWSRRWQARMSEPITQPPTRLEAPGGLERERIRTAGELGVEPRGPGQTQRGGESRAGSVLDGFLAARGVDYRWAMSSPVTAWEGCSRLSPYLAWGAISMRQVHQATEQRRRQIRAERKAGREVDRRWLGSLQSFAGRLRWHCHFMQKLEDEPELEFRNLNRAYDGLREEEFDGRRFAAWCEGRTGYPMVDACMRCLHRTGWINFRMRAMLVSFACHHLWLHWREPAVFLGRCFLDFEPGIHFPQFQMQAGVTGINTVRIYSPIKQVHDQDPTGIFLRRWLPELEGVPDEHVAEPHRMSEAGQRAAGCVIGRDYPAPIVEHRAAYAEARRRLHQVKRSAEAREEAERVYRRHGSRRRPPRRRGPKSGKDEARP